MSIKISSFFSVLLIFLVFSNVSSVTFRNHRRQEAPVVIPIQSVIEEPIAIPDQAPIEEPMALPLPPIEEPIEEPIVTALHPPQKKPISLTEPIKKEHVKSHQEVAHTWKPLTAKSYYEHINEFFGNTGYGISPTDSYQTLMSQINHAIPFINTFQNNNYQHHHFYHKYQDPFYHINTPSYQSLHYLQGYPSFRSQYYSKEIPTDKTQPSQVHHHNYGYPGYGAFAYPGYGTSAYPSYGTYAYPGYSGYGYHHPHTHPYMRPYGSYLTRMEPPYSLKGEFFPYGYGRPPCFKVYGAPDMTKDDCKEMLGMEKGSEQKDETLADQELKPIFKSTNDLLRNRLFSYKTNHPYYYLK